MYHLSTFFIFASKLLRNSLSTPAPLYPSTSLKNFPLIMQILCIFHQSPNLSLPTFLSWAPFDGTPFLWFPIVLLSSLSFGVVLRRACKIHCFLELEDTCLEHYTLFIWFEVLRFEFCFAVLFVLQLCCLSAHLLMGFLYSEQKKFLLCT